MEDPVFTFGFSRKVPEEFARQANLAAFLVIARSPLSTCPGSLCRCVLRMK
jgi:hypothetical protein